MSGVRGVVAVLVALLLVGCSSGGESEVDRVFLEGRETVEVFRLMPPEGFDGEARVREWAALMGIEDRFSQADPDLGFGLSDDDGDGVGVDYQTGSFGYSSGTHAAGRCTGCAPVTISLGDAIVEAQVWFERFGFDVSEFVWDAKRVPEGGLQDVAVVRVEGQPMLEGRAFGRPWAVEFGNGEELLVLRGSVNVPVSRGVVGLLSPGEALAQRSGELAVEVPVESLDAAVLGWSVSFDRFELTSFMVPVWRFPLNAELGLETEVLAIRRQDVPTE